MQLFLFRRLLRDERGVTLVEDSLAVGLIALLCITGIAFLGAKLHAMWALWGSWELRLRRRE